MLAGVFDLLVYVLGILVGVMETSFPTVLAAWFTRSRMIARTKKCRNTGDERNDAERRARTDEQAQVEVVIHEGWGI